MKLLLKINLPDISVVDVTSKLDLIEKTYDKNCISYGIYRYKFI